MEDADILGGDAQGAGVGGRQGVAGLAHDIGREGDAPGGGTVQLQAPGGHSCRAACLHGIEDRAHRVADARLGALRRSGQSLALLRRGKRRPVDLTHHIIFSMGSTRMDEAPSAFSRSSVSQKTAS